MRLSFRMFTLNVPRDRIETTGAMPAQEQHAIPLLSVHVFICKAVFDLLFVTSLIYNPYFDKVEVLLLIVFLELFQNIIG